jgi:predicted transcriptional regulator
MGRNGVIPKEPYADAGKVRVLSTKATPELIKQVRLLAVAKDCTSSVIVKMAVQEYIARNMSLLRQT